MKISFKKTRGNVLFATLFITGLISVGLGSYLNMVRSENQFTEHSQTWNLAVPVAEAGIEEALAQLQATFSDLQSNNGWTRKGNVLMKERKLNDNEKYIVCIDANGAAPIIVSEGFTRAPRQKDFVSRTIRVNTKIDGYPLAGMGSIALTTISMNGSTEFDSFDSTTNTASTNGKYVSAKRGAEGYLATLSSGDNIQLGNGDVWGKIASAPGGTPQIGPNGRVGDAAWQSKGKGIQPGAYAPDMNFTVEPVTAPFTSGLPPAGTSGSAQVLGTGDYAAENLSGTLLVTGKARLLVTKSFNLSKLVISNITGTASLELYVAAPSVNLSGNGQLNVNGRAANFKYFGLAENKDLNWPGNKTFNAGGNGEFTAMIYAPLTDLILHGGGNGDGFSGASLTKSMTIKGNYGVHYDKSLANEMNKGYIAISWDEMLETSASLILAKNLTGEQIKYLR